MKRVSLSPLYRVVLSLALLAAILLGVGTRWTGFAGAALSPEGEVREAWRRAQDIGQYHFTSELVQTTHPGPALVNVGRSSETQRLYMEGETDLPADQLQLALWQNEGSAVNQHNGIEIRIDGTETFGRVAGGEWQEMPEFANAFAPGQDLMGYLAGMRKVRDVGVETRAMDFSDGSRTSASYRHYVFEVDGPDFAAYMRDQMEQHLIKHGELPVGMSLGLSDLYLDITGEGEVWLDGDGLPRRIKMHIVYPEMKNGDWVEATVINDFFGYPAAQASLLEAPLKWLAGALSPPRTGAGWGELALQAGMMSAVLNMVLVLITVRRSRVLYAAVAIAVIVSTLVTPLLQGHRAYAFGAEQEAKRAEQDAAQKEIESQREYARIRRGPEWNPHVDPLTAKENLAEEHPVLVEVLDLLPSSEPLTTSGTAQKCAPDSDNDFDGDGLSDKFEAFLGTGCANPDSDGDGLSDGVEFNALGISPSDKDSDGDGLYDNAEVQGFEYGGKRWYSAPLNPDTDGDGVIDGVECPERFNQLQPSELCRDTDGDGTPDIFDTDNDDDGVPDSIDISPQSQQGTFSVNKPFTFKIESNQVNAPIVVDVQLRPTNLVHLSYAQNVLDWPMGDEKGQIQRQKDNAATFADLPGVTPEQRNADPTMTNGDIRLLPMLEVEMSGIPLPLPMTMPSVTLTIPDTLHGGNLNLQHISDTQVKFSFPEGRSYNLKIYEGPCHEKGRMIRSEELVSEQYTLSGLRLTDFANGKHSILLTVGIVPECIDVPDIPNGQYPDRMVDQSVLNQYGMMAQDTNEAGRVVVYVPLNVVPDETGGGRVAFAARLLYQQPEQNWGNQHEMRVVWMVQMLTDACKPVPKDLQGKPEGKKWCNKAQNWNLNQSEVTHTYYEDWNLTGLTVREDHGLDVAIVSPYPATGGSSLLDKDLWKLANGLERTFINARSQDGVTRDMTIAEIARRFSYGSSASDVERWGIPNTTFNVDTYAFANLDEIARLATQYNRTILAAFSSDKKPTLLTARESRSRNANIDEQWNAASATLAITGDVNIVTAFQWTAYHHTEGGWQPYALDIYLDQMGAALKPFFEGQGPDYYDPNDPDVLKGAIVSAQTYSMVLVNGINNTVPPKLVAEGSQSSISDSSLFGVKNDRVITKTAADVVVGFIDLIFAEDAFRKGLQLDLLKGKGVASHLSLAGRFKILTNSFWVQAKGKTLNSIQSLLNLFNFKKTPVKSTLFCLAILAVLLITAVLATVYIAFSPDKIKAAIKFVNATMKVVSAFSFIYSAYTKLKQGMNALMGSVKASPLVGIIIAGVIALGLLALQVTILIITGQGSLTNLANAVADMIAGLAVSIVMLLLSLTGVGAVILAIMGAIDALIAAVCALLPDEWTEGAQKVVDNYAGGVVDICGGITGTVTKWVKGSLYSNVKIVTFDSETRLAFTRFNPHPDDATKGFETGNNLTIDLELQNELYLTSVSNRLASSWMTMVYFWQYNLAVLRRSSFNYVLSPVDRDIHKDVAFNAHYTDWYYAENGSKAVGADGFNYNPGAWAISNEERLDVPMLEAGFNQPFELYLLEGYSVPLQECIGVPVTNGPLWIIVPICWIRPEWDTRPIPLTESLVFDIFPDTLDEFYHLEPSGGGYALGWGNSDKLSFPTLRDADGDKLPHTSDPNDARWDSDGDGLNDYFEVQQGFLPTASDGDGDGLNDRMELLYKTDPFRSDTDGDGLTDSEELLGWEFVYDFNGGNPKATWVTSDPLEYDTDADGIRDDREKVFGFNPRVWSDPKVLDFKAQVSEQGATQVLLRFEEGSRGASFSDASGYGNNATCSGTACPAMEADGHYGYARNFDGVDDALELPGTAFNDLRSGTIATWVYLDSNDDEILFAKQHEGGDAYGVLSVGYSPKGAGTPGRVYYRARSDTSLLFSNALLQAGRWYHVAVTFDIYGACVHIDGQQDACEGGNMSIPDVTGETTLTLGAAGGHYLDGQLDEFAIFPYLPSHTHFQRLIAGEYTYEDAFVQPGASMNYEGTVTNELNGRYAEGVLSSDLPAAIENPPAPRNFTLKPRDSVSLNGALKVRSDATSQRLNLTQVAGARVTDPRAESNYANLQLHFEEAPGATTFKDTSGYPEYPASCSGTTCPTAGQAGLYGSALTFDGSNDYVQVPYAAALNENSFTVAAWVNVTGGSGYRSILTSRDSDPDRGYILYVTPDNTWEFWVGTGAQNWAIISGGAVIMNRWTHLAGVYNAATQTMYFYVDGKLVGSKADVTFAPNTQRPLRVGAGVTEGPADFHFAGAIDDVRVFNHVLIPADVAQLAQRPVSGVESVELAYSPTAPGSPHYNEPAPAGQVLHMPLDDQPNKSGNVAFRDVAALARNETRSGSGSGSGSCSGTACPTTGAPGRRGTAASFDGVDDAVDLPYAADINPASFTVAAWANATGGSGYRAVLASREGLPPRGYTIYATPHNTWEFWSGTGTDWVTVGSEPVKLGVWTHLAGVYDATSQTLRFYVDGKLAGTQTGVTFAPNTQYPLRIGAGRSEDTPHYFFTGAVDEVRIFDRAFTTAEVENLWRGVDPLLHLTFDDQRVIDTALRDRSAWDHDGVLHATVNVAPGKAATQSSTYAAQNGAERAVDGITDGNFAVAQGTHTNHEHRPWWQVDLGLSHEIEYLKLWNRTDGSSERLSNFYVLVSDNPFVSTDLDVALAQPNVWSYYHAGPAQPETKIPVGRTGRYVRVQLAGSNFLSLAEVQVWGHLAEFTNVARGMPAAQSSTVSGLEAARAVDGYTDGNFTVAPGSQTYHEYTPWWQVDLGASYTIDTIDLWNCTQNCYGSLRDFYVFVSDAPFTSNDPGDLKQDPNVWHAYYEYGTGVEQEISVNRSGRFVRVQLNYQPNYYGDYELRTLSLAEVQVWVQNPNPLLSNLAERQEAFQSSNVWPDNVPACGAGLAIDGDTDGDFTAGSVTHTGQDGEAWWQVDLGEAHYIETIDLWNRTDGSSERLSDFYVFVSNEPFAGTSIAAVKAQPGMWWWYYGGTAGDHATIPVNRSGRYVRVQLANTNHLSLAEVQVWGYDSTPPLRTVRGRVGNGALALNGGNDYVALPNAALNDLGAGTLATWVYLEDNTAETIVASQSGSGPYGLLSVGYSPALGQGDAGRVYFHAHDGAQLLQSNTLLQTKRWYHVAVTFNAGGACVHIDGVIEDCAGGDQTIPDDPSATPALGAYLGDAGGHYLAGQLDDFIVYPRVLLPIEVAELAQRGWQTSTLSQSGAGVSFARWSADLPAGLEGAYRIDVRGSDVLGQEDTRVQSLGQWQGTIDTLAPRVTVQSKSHGSGQTTYAIYEISAQDFNLSTEGYAGPCDLQDARLGYYTSPWYLSVQPEGSRRLYTIHLVCTEYGAPHNDPITFCDVANNCTTVIPTHGPQHAANTPLLDALVLTPTHRSVLTALDPVTLAGAAYAQDGLATLTVTVNSAPVDTRTWPGGVVSDTWSTAWTPAADGAYRVAALLADQFGRTLTATHPITLYVDTQAPAIAIASTVLTTTHHQANGILTLQGTATDVAGVAQVEWQLDGGAWQGAQLEGTTWQGLWPVGFDDLPNGESFALAARATDLAGRTAETSATLTVDLVGPQAVTLTHEITNAQVTLAWTESNDPGGLAGYVLEWTTQITETGATLVTHHPAGSGGSVTRPAVEGTRSTLRLGSRDAHGNTTWQTLGPVHVEGTFTPDYVTPGAGIWYRGWTESGCSLVGTDVRIRDRAVGGSALNTAQDLYAGWNSEGLRLTWRGANWRHEGDLFV